jgi:malate dehydrogenase
MMRLDHNRAMTQVAQKTGKAVTSVKKMSIWGNHSATQYPDIFHAEVDGKNAAQLVNDQAWIEGTFIPVVQKRGAAIIDARGLSSAASAANAAIDHVRDWVLGTSEWVSMGVPSDGSYGIPEGLVFGFPCTTAGGKYTIVQGLAHNDFAKAKIAATQKELTEERSAIEHLLK